MSKSVTPTVFGVYRVGLHLGKKVVWSLPVFALDDVVIEDVVRQSKNIPPDVDIDIQRIALYHEDTKVFTHTKHSFVCKGIKVKPQEPKQ